MREYFNQLRIFFQKSKYIWFEEEFLKFAPIDTLKSTIDVKSVQWAAILDWSGAKWLVGNLPASTHALAIANVYKHTHSRTHQWATFTTVNGKRMKNLNQTVLLKTILMNHFNYIWCDLDNDTTLQINHIKRRKLDERSSM